MKITEVKIKVKDLVENYSDNGDGGVYGYNNRLTIRPSFQREFIYSLKESQEVIRTIIKKFPLGLIYWSKIDDDHFEVIDGQQRIISICEYVNGDFSVDNLYFHNKTDVEQNNILDYDLMIQLCEGDEREKLEWFKVINIATKTLTDQELLNATYTGPWLADAKNFFSKRNCVALRMAEGYLTGNPIRQEILETVLRWIADRDGLPELSEYMALHQHDEDASDLRLYFQNVINWAKVIFPTERKGITDKQEWGELYNKYGNNKYNPKELDNEIRELILDDDVTKKAGIIPYLLSGKDIQAEKYLSLRSFTEAQKLKAYERQKGICPICGKQFKYEEMQGDHKVPWSKGGHTTDDNLQMLCATCNVNKRDN